MSVLASLKSLLKLRMRFGREERGSVAVIFALALIPMLGLAGMAIDYAVNINARARARAAVDATALALARLPSSTGDADLVAKSKDTITASLNGTGIDGLAVTTSRIGGDITVTVTGTTPTSLTKLIGFRSLPLQVVGTSTRALTGLEIALVLDNTGSMAGAKLANLKSAATDLVTKLYAKADPTQPGSLKIGVVPFTMTVNVGPGYLGSDWLDMYAESSVHKQIFNASETERNRFNLFKAMNKPWAGCVEARPMPNDVRDTAPTRAVPDTLYVPYFAPDESDNDSNAVNDYQSDASFTDFSTWGMTNRQRQGITSKYGKFSWKVSATARQAGTNYLYGPNSGCEIQPLTRLSTSQKTVTDAIAAMTVIGDTNIPLGMMWGWHLLSPNGPFRDGAAYNDGKTVKYIVLMTDGQNQSAYSSSDNASFYSGIGFIWQNRIGTISSDMAARGRAIDDRLTALCANTKAAGIRIFTVRVEVFDGSSDVLRTCASAPSMFYDVKDSSLLATAFQAIADQITELRLSK